MRTVCKMSQYIHFDRLPTSLYCGTPRGCAAASAAHVNLLPQHQQTDAASALSYSCTLGVLGLVACARKHCDSATVRAQQSACRGSRPVLQAPLQDRRANTDQARVRERSAARRSLDQHQRRPRAAAGCIQQRWLPPVRQPEGVRGCSIAGQLRTLNWNK